MVGFEDLKTGITVFKGLTEGIKKLSTLRDDVQMQELMIDINSKITAAQELVLTGQQNQALLVAEIDDLKKKIMKFENWETEKAKYELKSLRRGSLIYVQKSGMQTSEPIHEICADCYNNGKKSLIHKTHIENNTYYKCNQCTFECHEGDLSEGTTVNSSFDVWES